MAEFFGVKVDTSKMTLEDLKKSRDKFQKILDTLNYEIKSRMICEHKHKI